MTETNMTTFEDFVVSQIRDLPKPELNQVRYDPNNQNYYLLTGINENHIEGICLNPRNEKLSPIQLSAGDLFHTELVTATRVRGIIRQIVSRYKTAQEQVNLLEAWDAPLMALTQTET